MVIRLYVTFPFFFKFILLPKGRLPNRGELRSGFRQLPIINYQESSQSSAGHRK